MNNKYVWEGKSAIIFNVRLNDLFEISDNDINLKDQYQGMTDLGYAFKSERSTTWTYRSIKRFSVPTITSLNDLLSDELLQKDTAYYNRYAPQYGHIYPFKVLLKKDELPSVLKINIGRYYRIRGNETIDYQQEVSLLPDAVNLNDISSVSYAPFSFPSSVGEINQGEFKKGLEDAIKIMNMMTNLNYEFTPSIIETSNPQEAANSKMEFNIRFQDAWLDKNYVRSLVIHEIAHNFLNKNFPSTEEQKQKVNTFMEFATGIDGATWQWLGNHNYPVIDGNNYSYIEDCLIAAACQLTKEVQNTDVSIKLKNVPKYVDMGLSVCWAEWNIGAQEIADFGLYFGWGDVSGNMTSINPYDYAVGFNMTSDSFAGDPKYDAAALHWGGKWRMPTEAEFLELAENSIWTHEERLSTTGESISGYLVTSKISGNSIFLPAGGYYEGTQSNDINSSALYWSANFDMSKDSNLPVYFHIDDTFSRKTGEKYKRILIRPVQIPETNSEEIITDEDPELDLRLIGTSTFLKTFYNNKSLIKDSNQLCNSGAFSMLIHQYGKNTGGITFTGMSEKCRISNIDDYAYIIYRTAGYNSWPAGNSSNTGSNTINFSTNNSPKISGTIKYVAELDEAQGILLRGDMTSKTIRIPSTGTKGEIEITRYPYTFYSELYLQESGIGVVNIDSVTKEAKCNIYNGSYSNSEISCEIESKSALDKVFKYNISNNVTNNYREFLFVLSPIAKNYGERNISELSYINTDNYSVSLQFVQEPYNKNRIYYGTGFGYQNKYYNDYSDEYYNAKSQMENYKYHYFFEACNSKIINDSESATIKCKAYDFIAFPIEFVGRVTLPSNNSYSRVSPTEGYSWGKDKYIILQFNTETDIKINKL